MSQQNVITFTTPCGRLVSGDAMNVYAAKDDQGRPVAIKSGDKQGQQRMDYYIGIAIPKTAGVDWSREPWGQKIMEAARRDMPASFDPATGQLYAGRQFAFKVTDGDSNVPNTKGNAPSSREGYRGNWVISFASSTGIVPRLYRWDTATQRAVNLEEGAQIKRGYYIQVSASVRGNGSPQQAGVYINPDMVCMIAFGPEISSGPNVADAGFGVAQLPAGASAIPMGGMPVEVVQQAPAPQVQAPAPQVQAPAPQAPVQPAYDIVNGPTAPTAPPAPAAPVEASYVVNGQVFTQSVLEDAGYTPAHFATLERA